MPRTKPSAAKPAGAIPLRVERSLTVFLKTYLCDYFFPDQPERNQVLCESDHRQPPITPLLASACTVMATPAIVITAEETNGSHRVAKPLSSCNRRATN